MLATTLQILMIITGIISFTLVVGSGLAIYNGQEGLSNRTRKALIIILAACVLFFPLAGQACDEDFRESIDNECQHIKCVSWAELEAAIAEASQHRHSRL